MKWGISLILVLLLGAAIFYQKIGGDWQRLFALLPGSEHSQQWIVEKKVELVQAQASLLVQIETLEIELNEKKEAGEAKVSEVQTKIEILKTTFDTVKQALETLEGSFGDN
jgi:hypothetical protein